ncbi:MAG: hypothetical protein BMS9Abin02_0338 [Anaerolineae bacterium]|nr:MAG: hypothetical protein BMS9Abin02_0338 [Anaerolineae bacterium]
MTKTVKMILLPIILLWVIIVITGYYWGHQFVLIPPLVGIVRSLILLVISLLFFITALGLGWIAVGPLGLSFENRFEAPIISTGLGLCVMSLLVLALGIAGLLNPKLFWLLILLGTVMTIFSLAREHRRRPFAFKLELSGLKGIDYFFLAFIGLTLLIGIQLALAPPVAWDGLTTHLVFVEEILEAGRLQPVAVTPGRFAGHMLFIWGMALGGDILPQLISYGMGLLMVAAVAVFSHRYFGIRLAILATAIFVSVEVFILNAGWPYLDVPAAFFGWLAVICLVNWQRFRTSSRFWLLLSAIFAVFASHTKLNGLFVFPVILIGYLLGLYWNRHEMRRRIIDGFIAFGAAVILSLIWSAAEAGQTLGGAASLGLIPPQAAAIPNKLPGLDSFAAKLGTYAKVLWEMTIIGQQGAVIYDGAITPLFLVLVPFLFFFRKKPRVVIFLMVAALTELAAWLIFPREYYQNRHLIIAYPIFSVLAAYVISRLDEFDFEWFTLSGFFRLLLILIFSLQLLSFLVWWESLNPLPYLLGLQSRDQYLASNLNSGSSPGYYDMMKVIDENLPEDSVVGMAWPEPRLYYCPGTCVRFPFARARSAEDMLSAAEENGLTHVLVSQLGIEYWLDFYEDSGARREDRKLYQSELSDFTSRYGQLIHNQDDSFYLYRLSLKGEGNQ